MASYVDTSASGQDCAAASTTAVRTRQAFETAVVRATRSQNNYLRVVLTQNHYRVLPQYNRGFTPVA